LFQNCTLYDFSDIHLLFQQLFILYQNCISTAHFVTSYHDRVAHIPMPVPFEKGTGTPQAQNRQDMQSENNSKCDRRTLNVIWQPFEGYWGHIIMFY
jgi:hypothetical protein